MAEDGGGTAEPMGTYVNAEDILGDEEDGDDDDLLGLDRAGTEERSQAAGGDGEEEPSSAPATVELPALDEGRVSSRPTSSPQAPDADSGEPAAVPWSLPPAPTHRNSTGSRDSRQSSHQEASTSGAGQQPTSPSSSLPPINQRGGGSATQQPPSSKGSFRSPTASPQPASPSRNTIAARTYYKPPPPPPPPPKPKPRAGHDTSAVDPIFLQTAVYRTVPNVGRVYDWKLQHDVNHALSKQRKQKAQMEKVLDAARLQLQVREVNERAFQQWMATKEQEKQSQHQQCKRINYVTTLYQTLLKEDPGEKRSREAQWVPNFGYPEGAAPGRTQAKTDEAEKGERFRL